VVSASERLMAGLLVEEERCFTRMADGLAVIAEELEGRLRARERASGLESVYRGREGLLPSLARFEELLLPPVGDLLVTVRERTLVVVRRQLAAAESTLARTWAGTGARAHGVARQSAGRLETFWYGRAEEGLARTVAQCRQDLLAQTGLWWARRESMDHLVRRWCQLEPLYLVGAHSRGAVWLVRGRMNAHARNAGVAMANGLTLAGITGWNEVTQVTA
jgi:hypothetical protein